MELTQSQAAAEEKILAAVRRGDRLVSLSGPAGTGKTTMIESLVAKLPGSVVCTPTNKAAQVLQSKGIEASTFYKTFYILEETDRGAQPRFISCARWSDMGRALPEGKIDHAPFLFIDEASMLTTRAARELQRMCDVLILVGDHNQLPPVGDDEHPAGLFGALDHTAELTEVLRQAEGSLILELANEIRTKGPRADKLLRVFEPQVEFAQLVTGGTQMIAFTNKERKRINHVCRRILGFTQPTPQPGDRVLITNNYSDDLINGTTAEVIDFEWDGAQPYAHIGLRHSNGRSFVALQMFSFFEDQITSQKNLMGEVRKPRTEEEINAVELTFAYCLTCHKSQGSEWDSVLVFDQRSLIRKVQENNPRAGMTPSEYVRRWTYTASTRARKELLVAPTFYAQVSRISEI